MRVRVLMLVRDLSWFGGVVNFVNSLDRNLGEDVVIDRFQIGQRKHKLGRWIRLIVPINDMLNLAAKISKKQYDIVHINPSLNSRSLLRDAMFMLIIRMRGIKNVLVFMHGWDDKTAAFIGKSSLLKWLFIRIFGRASVIYVLANTFQQTLVDWGIDNSRVQVITTMFDGQQFDGVVRKRVDDNVQLLFLSRFVKEKGIYELFTAFNRMRKSFPALRLIMAGDGPEMKAMHEWVNNAGLENYVSFTGYVRDKKKAQVLVDADIFVLPSYSEGCPVSLLEAMAAGLPVVSSDVGGVSNVIVPDKNGFLLDEATPEKIEAAIRNLLEDSDKRVRMSENNRAIAWKNYEASIVSGGIEKTYRRLVSQG